MENSNEVLINDAIDFGQWIANKNLRPDIHPMDQSACWKSLYNSTGVEVEYYTTEQLYDKYKNQGG